MDWIDPNTWKLPAELIGYWQAILVGVVAIVGSIASIFLKPLHWLRSRTKSKVRQKSISLSFVQNDLRCRWGVARLSEQLGTHVHGHWHVTNSSERNVMILKARLGKYATPYGYVSTRDPEDERYSFGDYPVLSHRMSEVSAEFTFFPPIGRVPKPIISDVIFTDNFGNEHRVRSQFAYIGPDKPY